MSTHPHGEQISAYVDGMLDVAQTRFVAAHLGRCAACRTTADEIQTVKSLLHEISSPALPSPEFWTAAYRRLRVADHAQAAKPGFSWEGFRGSWQPAPRRWAAGVAGVAALGAILASPLYRAPTEIIQPPVSVMTQDSAPDVSALVQAHTDSVARLPLADPDRQKMIAADEAQPIPSDTSQSDASQADTPEAAGDADAAF